MNKIQFFLYHTFLRIMIFILKGFYPILPRKAQCYFNERQYPHLVWRKVPKPHQRRIWFHASSGEVEYIKTLLKHWKSQFPEDLLFLSYFSTSARDMIPKILEIDGWSPLPIDLPKPCTSFINQLNPHLLIISRTDLWPTILMVLKNQPKVLVASTWSDGNHKTKFFGRIVSQWCLPYLNKVCVVSKADSNWISKHLHKTPNVVITGDPRFDQVRERLSQKRLLPQSLLSWISNSNGRVFIAGSTWEQDENYLVEALRLLKKANSKIGSPEGKNILSSRTIFVPHEVNSDSIQKLKQQLIKSNLEFLLWSECKNSELNQSISILIFDEKGWLADLYQIAHFAFIGGSFKKQVHSVMEALGCGIPVLVGPNYKNNREAIEFADLEENNIYFVTVLKCQSEFIAQKLNFFFNLEHGEYSKIKIKIIKAFDHRCGGTHNTFKAIIEYL